jgi:hypothetical protein
MATVYGVNATKNLAPTHQTLIGGDENQARVRWMHDSYEAAALAAGSVLVLGNKVPAGAQILPGSLISFDAMGSNTQCTIGTTVSGVDLAAAAAMTSAGNIAINDLVDLYGTKSSSAKNIYVTATSSGAWTGTVRMSLMYAMV